MKKIYVLLVFLFAFFAFSFIPVKADGPVVTLTNGASVRTEDPVGLKFEATITGDFEGSTIKYGFILSKGSYTLEQMKTNYSKDKATFVDCGVPNGEGKIFVTIIGIPESGYTGDITVVALVNIDGEKTYSNIAVTRNIAEVAAISKALGETGDIIDDVNAYVGSNYKIKNINSLNQVVLSDIDTNVYKYDQISTLWSAFITDYNAATGASLTVSTTQSEFVTSFSNNIADNNVVTFPSTNNAVKFFDGINLVKWGWLLEYFEEYGETHVGNQANGLLRLDRTVQSYGRGYKLYHLANSIYNLFTKGTDNGPGDFPAVSKFGTESAYTNVWAIIRTHIANTHSNLIAVGNEISLPNIAGPNYYSLTKYQANSTDYAVGYDYEVTATSVVFKPVYTPINYTILYELNGGTNNIGNPDFYNVESSTIVLANATKADYVFGGWYDNALFSGSTITSIPSGSHGNISLYAKWLEPEVVELNINNYDAGDKEVLNTVTPDIIVVPGLSAGIYKIINTTNVALDSKEYTVGSNAFATISAAVSAVGDGKTIIYVFAGDYDENITITYADTKIYGSNFNKLGKSDSRNTETNIEGLITVSANNVIIKGIQVSGEGNSITWTSSRSNLTIENCLFTDRGQKFSSSRYASIGSANGITTLNIIGVKVYYDGGESVDAIYVNGTVSNLTIENCELNNKANSFTYSEAIRCNYISGTVSIKNNNIIWSTRNFGVTIGNNSNSCTNINYVNNILRGSSEIRTTSLGIYNIKSTCTANVIGNYFEYFDTGSTLLFTNSVSGAKIYVKYNYFSTGVSYKCTSPVTPTYTSNLYVEDKTTATTESSPVTTLGGLISAYRGSGDFATYGSICVYDD